MTEQEFLETVDRVVSFLAAKFRFGYFEIADMKQQGRLFAIEAMGRYDGKRRLDSFLFIHIRNRFINFKRDKYKRSEPPCKSCPFYDPKFKKSVSGCAAFGEKLSCDKYKLWIKHNKSKMNLVHLMEFNNETIDSETEYDQSTYLEETISKKLPSNIRSDYLKMIAGVNIPEKNKLVVREAVKNIFDEIGYSYDKN